MKLQVAFDVVDFKEMCAVLDTLDGRYDIIEFGTPMCLRFGMEPVTALKEKYKHAKILADIKIMDGGYFEANAAYEAGADIATCCSAAADATIIGALKAAKDHGKELLVDLINTKENELSDRVRYLDELGVDYICVHTAADVQSAENNPIRELRNVRQMVKNSKISVAGGIKMNTLNDVVSASPDVVIVGSAITSAEDPKEACRTMYSVIKGA